MVTPYAGVWIEIIIGNCVSFPPNVTPYAGVWIEIFLAYNDIVCLIVTPYAGVWIEIYITIAKILSAPAVVNKSATNFAVIASLPDVLRSCLA